MKINIADHVVSKYKTIKEFYEVGEKNDYDLIAVENYNGLWGFINLKGEEVIPCQFAKVSAFQDGLSAIELPNNQGANWIDKTGRLLFEENFRKVTPFQERHAIGLTCYRDFVIVNKEGKKIKVVKDRPWLFTSAPKATTFKNGYAIIHIDTFDGNIIVDYNGAIKDEEDDILMFQEIKDVQNGFAAVKKYNSWTYLKLGKDRKGHTISNYIYSEVGTFTEGLGPVCNIDGLWGFINENGQISIDYLYSKVFNFSCGLAAVKQEDNWFYINREGLKQFAKDFEWAEPFVFGYAIVKQHQGLFGVINKQGKFVIPPTYKSIQGYNNNSLFIVKNADDLYGLVDENGNIIVGCIYNKLSDANEGLFRYLLGNKWGCMNNRGQIITPPKYDLVDGYVNGYSKALKDGEWIFLDKKCQELGKCKSPLVGHMLCYRFDDDSPTQEYMYRSGEKLFSFPKTFTSLITTDNYNVFVRANSQRELLEKKSAVLKEIYELEIAELNERTAETLSDLYYLSLKKEEPKN